MIPSLRTYRAGCQGMNGLCRNSGIAHLFVQVIGVRQTGIEYFYKHPLIQSKGVQSSQTRCPCPISRAIKCNHLSSYALTMHACSPEQRKKTQSQIQAEEK